MESLRIQKYISECGVMSRRSAEREIEQGNILINGERATLGQKIDPDCDTVEYKGRRISLDNHRQVYIMLNKPRGYVTTLSDERGRPKVTDLISGVGERVYPVGRLDMDSEGLIILTNDGELTNELTHPGHKIGKVYHVKVASEVSPEQLSALSKPMRIDDYDLKPVNADIITRKNGQTVLRMELFEGRNRQIRKMCESLGLEVISLRRVSIGALKLGNLPTGQWRYLTKNQVNLLKRG